MGEQEVKLRLERTLHTRITAAEWLDIEDQGHVRDYEEGELSWRDLYEMVDEVLGRLRRFLDNPQREQAGELSQEIESSERVSELTGVSDISVSLTDRTAARAGALCALDNLRLGPETWGSVLSRQIGSRIRPHGGFDGTLPQWVIELEIEAWVPADDVRSIYQHAQRVYAQSSLLVEQGPPKTQPRTYNVARYVWEEELRCGKRPSWPVLLERWNERYPDKKFSNYHAFRTCFKRGEEATLPRYPQTDDDIASEAREYLEVEARRLRQRLQHLPK